MKPFTMAFPETITEACETLATTENAQLIAGGTAITVVMKEGVFAPDELINIRGLEPDLRYIDNDASGVEIGALATLRDIETNDHIQTHFPTISDCIREIAGVRVRNSATIGGHLAHADIHLDLPPVLAGYDATVTLTNGDETRTLPITEFMQGYYETALDADELITSLTLPIPDHTVTSTYLKHRYFSAVDWPCVGVAAFASIPDDRITTLRVLLNSVSPTPILDVPGINDLHDGQLTPDSIDAIAARAKAHAQPSSDLRGTAAYKERMVEVFTRRALNALKTT